MKDNNIFDFVRYGLSVETSKNITIDGNWLFDVNSRHLTAGTAGDPVGGILGCANKNQDRCVNVKIINNIVAGVEASTVDTTGYSVMGHECDNYNHLSFKDNIAHSIQGYGAIIFVNITELNQRTCLEASYFTAYKCVVAGIVSNQATDNIIFSNMILIDNGFSAVPMVGKEGDD